MRTRHVGIAVAFLLALPQLVEAQKQKPPRRDRNKITAEEIAEKPTAQTAYDLVKSLRPQWLTSRGSTTILQQEIGVVVYRDGSKMGSVDELYTIPSDQIKEMRFLSPGDATIRFGTDHPRGAIEIETKQG